MVGALVYCWDRIEVSKLRHLEWVAVAQHMLGQIAAMAVYWLLAELRLLECTNFGWLT